MSQASNDDGLSAVRTGRVQSRQRWPRERQWAELEDSFQQRLDTIDWATCGPYLAAK